MAIQNPNPRIMGVLNVTPDSFKKLNTERQRAKKES